MKNNRIICVNFIIFLIILQFFCFNFCKFSINSDYENNHTFAFFKNTNINQVKNNQNKSNQNNKKDKVESSAKAMVTMESNSGRILYSKNENERLPMASTTKIITAIVAIENCKDLDKKHQIPKDAVGIEGSSIYLRTNEHLSIRELLYGLMLRSGNDSAVAIAIIVGGSLENFVKMMNDFCARIKLDNTSIVTVNGLHDDKHFTSALDLAKVTSYALKNNTFRKIVSAKNAKISDENAKNGERYLKNKNKLLWNLDGATGVKTGYTKKAGRCFVGSAKKNNLEIICVVLDCPLMFEECSNLIKRAFCEFTNTKIFEKGVIFYKEINHKNGNIKIPVILTSDIYYPLSIKNFSEEFSEIKARTEIIDNLSLPIKHSDEIGKLEITFKNNLIFSQKLFTINAEEKKEESLLKKIIRAF